MRVIFLIVSIILITLSCKNKDYNDVIELDGRFIRLVSKEKTEWILELFCLYSITPADIEDPRIGLKERLDILNGKKILSDLVFDSLECNPIRLPKSLDTYKGFIDSVKNNDSIRISSLPYSHKGIYINELIKRGYIVTFADDEGKYYVRKKEM